MSTQTTTAVAIALPDKLEQVRAELAKLTKIGECPYKTGNTPILGVKICDATDEGSLHMLSASVSTMEAAYNKVTQDRMTRGIVKSTKVYLQNGFTSEEINADIDLRLQVLNTESRRVELDTLLNEYADLLDKADKRRILDEKFAALTGLE